MYSKSPIKILAGNSNMPLAQEIAKIIGVPLADANIRRFSDGEVSYSSNEGVRGADVFLIQSTSAPVNENLMELLVMIDACKRASSARITAVIPYYGYARQDRKSRARDPISAKLVADLLTTAGANRVLTMDLHAAQIQGFFNIPVDHLYGLPVFTEEFKEMFAQKEETVIVSPDVGSANRTRAFAERLDLPMAIVDKRRPKANVSEVMNIIGEVSGKRAIMLDDMADTAGTLCHAADALIQKGATEVFAFTTHAVLSGGAIDNIKKSCIKELIILDTIELPKEKQIDKINVISVAPLFAEAIKRIHNGHSLSALFDKY